MPLSFYDWAMRITAALNHHLWNFSLSWVTMEECGGAPVAYQRISLFSNSLSLTLKHLQALQGLLVGPLDEAATQRSRRSPEGLLDGTGMC